ncbi:putative reverse transcriptase domain-containing protein [Tanacetum coccineum]
MTLGCHQDTSLLIVLPAALEAQAANNGKCSDNTNRTPEKESFLLSARKCSYKEVHQLSTYQTTKVTEGAVGLIRWFERTESVFFRSNCIEDLLLILGIGNLMSHYGARFEKMMEVFIGGLPRSIEGNVTTSKPQTLQEAINISQRLMDQKENETWRKRNEHFAEERSFVFVFLQTLSSLALNIFRLRYYNDEIFPIHIPNQNEDTFIRKAYYGGHTDSYKPYGENLYYYDVNSLYPFVMKEYPMPCGKPVWYSNLEDMDIDSMLGFIEAYVKNHKNNSSHGRDQETAFQLLKQKLCEAPILALPEGMTILLFTVMHPIKVWERSVRDRKRSYANVRRRPLEFQVGDRVMLKVSPHKGVIRFGKRGKLNPRYIGPFKFLKRIGLVAYKLELPEELSNVHSTFYVSNLKKCLSNESLIIPMKKLQLDDKLNFVEEPMKIMDREVKQLKQSRIPIVKVRWNSKRGP